MDIQDKIRVNEWRKLPYFDSRQILNKSRDFQTMTASWPLETEVRNLRKSKQKRYLEGRQAALFCYGMGVAVQRSPVMFAFSPSQALDYDCVARWQDGETQLFAPIQLKELPPEAVNPEDFINDLIAKLKKYPVSDETIVAIHVNRRLPLTFADLKIPDLRVAQLWLFGASLDDQSAWFLFGDLTRKPIHYEFTYPT